MPVETREPFDWRPFITRWAIALDAGDQHRSWLILLSTLKIYRIELSK